MWHEFVLRADNALEHLALRFLNTCSDHPMVAVGILALMLALACTMWVQTLELRLEAIRTLPDRPIQLRRRVG